MSVTEIVARLRHTHARLTDECRAAALACTAIADGATIFAAATTGSGRPEVERIHRLAAASGAEVRAAHILFIQTQDLIDTYCHDLTGHGIAEHEVTTTALARNDGRLVPDEITPRPPEATLADPATRHAEWIAELRRAGGRRSVRSASSGWDAIEVDESSGWKRAARIRQGGHIYSARIVVCNSCQQGSPPPTSSL
ncbi:hypothetical protein FHR81_001175 [Actinoalloteichus hoggarensis]|uniref:Uncharacterized protein n=1 Tax=Actinoalloteichus hoggarensis TaxID=1470176 RepID=A0A221VZH1_9PSEU|nr:hypothetical protein [Actinoalloteichus hoggarensis]ASO18910.1 hypothetical protein AHOG_06290 [Actinoalloteichus hoggarensis]MBB5920145.1 hypothetical protein [Actinoalloteichus hoggarensis]